MAATGGPPCVRAVIYGLFFLPLSLFREKEPSRAEEIPVVFPDGVLMGWRISAQGVAGQRGQAVRTSGERIRMISTGEVYFPALD